MTRITFDPTTVEPEARACFRLAVEGIEREDPTEDATIGALRAIADFLEQPDSVLELDLGVLDPAELLALQKFLHDVAKLAAQHQIWPEARGFWFEVQAKANAELHRREEARVRMLN